MSYQHVLDYWFEPGKSSRWFGGGAAVDVEIKKNFGKMVDTISWFIFLLLGMIFSKIKNPSLVW